MSPDLSSLLVALGIFSVGFISIGPNILAITPSHLHQPKAAQGKNL